MAALKTLFETEDYRSVIKVRIKELGRLKRGFTLKKVSERLGVQYTFLSRSLSHPKCHLNEDHFFQLCQILEFFQEEVQYLELLRARELATHPGRKATLQDRIERIRKTQKLAASVQTFDSHALFHEIGYLFDPLCVITHVAMFIKSYQEAPDRLKSELGIDDLRLREILTRLEQNGFIDLDEKSRVIQVHSKKIHYGKDHPLMRAHQNLLRSLSGQHLVSLPEAHKKSFMVTFSSDPVVFDKISKRFDEFIKDVETFVRGSKSQQVYQLNFDLFKWLG